jgi:hypothetical protein
MKVFKFVLLGCGGLLVLALVALFTLMSVAVKREEQRWVPVQGRVVSVEPLCKIASQWREFSSRDRSLTPRQRTPAMACTAARDAVAREPGGSDARVIDVVHVVYAYISPADQRSHEGQFDIENWFPNGSTLPITQGDSIYYWDLNPGSARPLRPGELDPAHPRPGTVVPIDADRSQADVSRYGTAHF